MVRSGWELCGRSYIADYAFVDCLILLDLTNFSEGLKILSMGKVKFRVAVAIPTLFSKLYRQLSLNFLLNFLFVANSRTYLPK